MWLVSSVQGLHCMTVEVMDTWLRYTLAKLTHLLSFLFFLFFFPKTVDQYCSQRDGMSIINLSMRRGEVLSGLYRMIDATIIYFQTFISRFMEATFEEKNFLPAELK